MLLYLMRHGIAQDRDDPDAPPDPERALTRKGAERTREVVRGLRTLEVDPGAVLTSPYRRAVETAAIAAEELGFDRARVVETESLLPGCPPAGLFAELEAVAAGEALVVGHAPGLDEALAFALGGRRAPFTALKKAGVACVEIESLAAPQGRLLWLLEPRALRGLAGKAGTRRQPVGKGAAAKGKTKGKAKGKAKGGKAGTTAGSGPESAGSDDE